MPAVAPEWDFDFEDDFLVVDGVETVELRRQNADGSFAQPIDVRATRETPNKDTVAGQMEAADVVWHLFGPDVGEAGVRPGDKVIDHLEDEYSITSAGLGGVLDQWRCASVKVPKAT